MTEPETDSCTISVENWQMQCCGTPFSVGDKVEWLVYKHDRVSVVTGRAIEYYYEKHSSDWRELLMLTGTVDEIKALFVSIELHPNPAENHNCTHHCVYRNHKVIEYADGWDKDSEELELGEYEVRLIDCTVRPAKKSEVTFS